jgi:hypothetical protein
MARPLSLSDSQFAAICEAVEPLAPADRSAFLGELAALLRNEPVVGDGTINQAVRVLLRRYFRPPTVKTEPNHTRRNVGPALE